MKDLHPTLTCLRCGHVWKRRITTHDPYSCMRCHSQLWNVPRPPRRIDTLRQLILEETDECIVWPYGSKDWYKNIQREDGTERRAHVLSWEITNKREAPEGMDVCHTCDNKRCINPKHLFIGTRKDNLQDASRKGRMHVGEKNGGAKLTENQVRDIRRIRTTTRTPVRELANRYGVKPNAIWEICTNKSWTHLT